MIYRHFFLPALRENERNTVPAKDPLTILFAHAYARFQYDNRIKDYANLKDTFNWEFCVLSQVSAK